MRLQLKHRKFQADTAWTVVDIFAGQLQIAAGEGYAAAVALLGKQSGSILKTGFPLVILFDADCLMCYNYWRQKM